MMFPSISSVSLALGLTISTAAAAAIPGGQSGAEIFKRWDTTVCTVATSNVPVPDGNNFKIPIEGPDATTISYGGRQTACWDLCVGDQTTTCIASQICYNFVGYILVFTYKPISGYTYTEADIWLGLSAPSSTTPTPLYTTSNGYCVSQTDGSVVCSIPYDHIVSTPDVLAGMCPYGDQGALTFFLYTNAVVVDSSSITYPVEGRLACQDWPTCSVPYTFTYWELGYRCTKCPDQTPPPVTEYCSFGTAFGYSSSASTLNSISPLPTTCKRWGWYNPFTSGISGPIYVGAGQNDISKAVNVGSWSAGLVSGKVVVTYSLLSGYELAQVHADVGCMPYTTCAPGKYLYVNEGFTTSQVTTFSTPGLTLPSCGTKQVYIIVHASIDSVTTIPAAATSTFVCAAAVAT